MPPDSDKDDRKKNSPFLYIPTFYIHPQPPRPTCCGPPVFTDNYRGTQRSGINLSLRGSLADKGERKSTYVNVFNRALVSILSPPQPPCSQQGVVDGLVVVVVMVVVVAILRDVVACSLVQF